MNKNILWSYVVNEGEENEEVFVDVDDDELTPERTIAIVDILIEDLINLAVEEETLKDILFERNTKH